MSTCVNQFPLSFIAGFHFLSLSGLFSFTFGSYGIFLHSRFRARNGMRDTEGGRTVQRGIDRACFSDEKPSDTWLPRRVSAVLSALRERVYRPPARRFCARESVFISRWIPTIVSLSQALWGLGLPALCRMVWVLGLTWPKGWWTWKVLS